MQMRQARHLFHRLREQFNISTDPPDICIHDYRIFILIALYTTMHYWQTQAILLTYIHEEWKSELMIIYINGRFTRTPHR